MDAYRIAHWDERFEVNKKGRAIEGYLPFDDRRKGPLPWVRWPADGLRIGPGFDRLLREAWRPGRLYSWAVLGIYAKLLEIAAAQDRDTRGWLVDLESRRRVTPDYFAERFNEPNLKLVREAFNDLVNLGWLEIHQLPETGVFQIWANGAVCEDGQKSGKSGNSRQIPRLNKHNTTEHNTTNAPENAGRKRPAEVQRQLDLLFAKGGKKP